jgi:hypothetical protein
MLSESLCVMTVRRVTEGPPVRGSRCFATLDELVADDLALVADATGLEPVRIRGVVRQAQLVSARWVWWTLLRERGLSHSAIGRLVGRDHSTIIYGLEHAVDCERTQEILRIVRAAP